MAATFQWLRSNPRPPWRSAAVGAASGLAAGAALVVAGGDATAAMVVVSCLGFLWAVAGIVLAVRHRCPAAAVVLAIAAAIAIGATAWSVNAHGQPSGATSLVADVGQRLAMTMLPALTFHLVLTMPNGHLAKTLHRRLVYVGYAVGAAAGLALLVDRNRVIVWPIVLLWLAVPLAAPTAHSSYRSAGVDRPAPDAVVGVGGDGGHRGGNGRGRVVDRRRLASS